MRRSTASRAGRAGLALSALLVLAACQAGTSGTAPLPGATPTAAVGQPADPAAQPTVVECECGAKADRLPHRAAPTPTAQPAP